MMAGVALVRWAGAGVVAAGWWAAPSPSPLRPDIDPIQVSPGLGGFVATFAVALACVVLFVGLTRQLRRMRHNAAVQGIGPDGPLPDGDQPSSARPSPPSGVAGERPPGPTP